MNDTQSRKRRLSGALNLSIEIPAVLVAFVMILHVSLNAILRTWFQTPIANTLEITTYWYLPIIAFLGFIAAAQRGQHISADLIYRILPHGSKKFVLSTLFLVSSVVCFGFAWFGLQEALHAMEIRKTAGVGGVISWPTYFLVPIAFGSLTLQFLYTAINSLRYPEDDHFHGNPDDAAVMEDLAVSEKATR